MMLIYDLATHEGSRLQGVATALPQHCLAIAREIGAADSWLLTEPDNDAARTLYSAMGGSEWPAVGYDFIAPTE